ncbi:MAG: hypothetical protein V5A62_02735 [Haloarculaceae archaeon]
MRTVEDGSGKRYVLLKRSGDASLVRDPITGEERYVGNEELSAVDGESALETAARAVPDPTRQVLRAAHSDRALGLLVELDERGAVPVRDLMGSYDLCESDLHGLLAEFAAAGLVTETRVLGERGYELADVASEGLSNLRE